MKKLLITLTMFVAGAGAALAGPYDKNPLPVDPCNCFLDGIEVGGYVGGYFADGDGDSAIGGGVTLGYFFKPEFGIEIGYGAFDVEPSEFNVVTGDLICRPWAQGACISPYFIAGGGVVADGENEGFYRAGAGVEFRSENFMDCLGIFLDGTYNWVNDQDDAVIARVGFRFSW